MPYDIEYFGICVFGELFNFRKTSETPVKSILYGNSLFPCKECFWEENHLKNHFWEIQTDFGKTQCFWEVLAILGNCEISGGAAMRRKGYKGRCENKSLGKGYRHKYKV